MKPIFKLLVSALLFIAAAPGQLSSQSLESDTIPLLSDRRPVVLPEGDQSFSEAPLPQPKPADFFTVDNTANASGQSSSQSSSSQRRESGTILLLLNGRPVILHEGDQSFSDAPLPQPKPAGFFTVGDFDAPMRSNRQAFHDKTWISAQAFWLAAIIYDSELTHQGVAHHNCVEGNLALDEHPSRGSLYLSDVPEYAVGTALNWLVLRYSFKPLIFLFPVWSSAEHIKGGTSWLLNCW